MNDDRWGDVIGKIEADFEVEKHEFEELAEVPNGKREIVIFVSPIGQIKMVRTTKPRLMDTKTQYSNRIGSDTAVENVYSEDEFVNVLDIYKWDDIEVDWVRAEFDI